MPSLMANAAHAALSKIGVDLRKVPFDLVIDVQALTDAKNYFKRKSKYREFANL